MKRNIIIAALIISSAILGQKIYPQSPEREVIFANVFMRAKGKPINGVIFILAEPNTLLVIKDGDRYVLDGNGLFVSAEAVRVEGNAEIISFEREADPRSGVADKGGDGPSWTWEAEPGNTGAIGGSGSQGKPGIIGNDGRNAGLVRIEVDNWVGTGILTIKNEGQKAGKGQKGGKGGTGGAGQKGGPGDQNNPIDCKKSGGDGGPGGPGGPAGLGGTGGTGGNGGTVILVGGAAVAYNNKLLSVSIKGGQGGDPGDPGEVGEPGDGGQGGDGKGPCGGGKGAGKGRPGVPAPPAERGKDGRDGQIKLAEIADK